MAGMKPPNPPNNTGQRAIAGAGRWGLPGGAVEEAGARTRDSKRFALPDGSGAVVIGRDLHYQASRGGLWQDVDLTIQQSAPGTWTMNNAAVMIAANAGSLQITERLTNISWMWVFQGGTVDGAGNVVYNGVPWQYTPTPTGVKSDATVTAKRGKQTYSWIYNTNAQHVRIDAAGNITSDTFTIPRATILRADGVVEQAGAWTLPSAGTARFAYDDSSLPASAYPYVIDPSTTLTPSSPATAFVQASSVSTGQFYAFRSTSAVIVALAQWSAAALPAGSTITGASIGITPNFLANTNGLSLNIQWYAPTAWPPTTADFIDPVPAGAASVPLANFTVNQSLTIPLSGAASAITPGGTVCLRAGLSSGATTGNNYLQANGAGVVTLTVMYTSTGTLGGTVNDASSGLPIQGATVSLNDPNNDSTTTTTGGSYSIGNIPAGSYTATISAAGFLTQTQPVTITAGSTTTLNVAMGQVQSASVTAHGSGTVNVALGQVQSASVTVHGTGAVSATPRHLIRASFSGHGSGLASVTPRVVISLVTSGHGSGLARLQPLRAWDASVSGNGAGNWTVLLRGAVYLQVSAAGSGNVQIAGRGPDNRGLAIGGQGNAAITLSVAHSLTIRTTGSGFATFDLRGPEPRLVVMGGTGSVRAIPGFGQARHIATLGSGAVKPTIGLRQAVTLRTSSSGAFTPTLRLRLATIVRGFGTGDLVGILTSTGSLPLGPLRLDVGPAGGSAFVPITPVITADVTWALDDLGTFTVTVPVTATNVSAFEIGREVHIIREGEGMIYAGLVVSMTTQMTGDGRVYLISGQSLARELTLLTTRYDWEVNAITAASAVDGLLPSGWTAGIATSPMQDVTARFDAQTRYQAITTLARLVQGHVLVDAVSRTLTILAEGIQRRLRLVLLSQAPNIRDETLFPITQLTIDREDDQLVTRIIPFGQGTGVNMLDLSQATLSSPYAVDTLAMPDGALIYYLEDTAASAEYGLHEAVETFKGVTPLANDLADIQAASDTLYQLATFYLSQHVQPLVTWTIATAGPASLHGANGWEVQPGDWVYVLARGYVENRNRQIIYADIAQWAYVTGIERKFDQGTTQTRSGGQAPANQGNQIQGGDVETVVFTLATAAVVVPTEADQLGSAISQAAALAVTPSNITFREIHGPQRWSINSAYPVTLNVNWDANIRYLHQAMLEITVYPVRSNVSAALGASTTSAGGTSHSHSISGQTSSGGTSHSHGIPSMATTGEDSHYHQTTEAYDSPSTWVDPAYQQEVILGYVDGNSGEPIGSFVGRGNTSPFDAGDTGTTMMASDHNHDTPTETADSEDEHTHNVAGQTSSSEDSHTHQVPAQNITMTYGIYQNTMPSTLGLHVLINGTDETTALGGPWNGAVTLDVTQYLVTAAGQPSQTQNTIELEITQAGALCDVEVELRSIVTMATVVPV